jgi:small subunit ribosomal protein S4
VISITESLSANSKRYPWIEWNEMDKAGTLINMPLREEIPENIEEQLIVELYSK